MSTYQNSLFALDVMQDRSGRIRACDKPPHKRADCSPRRHLRLLPMSDKRAEKCEAYNCEFNLIGQIAQLPERQAVNAMVARHEKDCNASCMLDVIEHETDTGMKWEGLDLDDISVMLGISRDTITQVQACIFHGLRELYGPQIQEILYGHE